MLNVVAKLAITAAMTAAQTALTMTRKIEGPRLDDLDVTLADYGTSIPRFWGKRRFEGVPIIWAERLREVHTESKTKGGKYDEYKYYGTWAVLICDHEIEAVSRVWMDKHLVYDATSTGPISSYFGIMPDGTRSPVKIQRGRNMRIYLGTETQEADARMESWCEDRYGANSCPAYRGSSYIVFEEIPLEKFGNRIPQISVEAIHTVSDSYPYESKDSDVGLAKFRFSPDQSRFIVDNVIGADTEIWDVPTRTKLISGNLPSGRYPAFDESGNIWSRGTIGDTLYQHDGDTLAVVQTITPGEFFGEIFPLGGLVYLQPEAVDAYLRMSGSTLQSWDIPFKPDMYFKDTDGLVWGIGAESGTVHLFCPEKGYFSASSGSTSSTAYGMDNGKGSFFVRHGNHLLVIDKETKAVSVDVSVPSNFSDSDLVFYSIDVGAVSVWFQDTLLTATEYSTETATALRTVTLSNWNVTDVGDLVYDPINHALITVPAAGSDLSWRYLDRVASAGVTLENVIEDVAEWCGLTSVEASDCTQIVAGYSVTQGTGKDMLSPLLDLHDSIARPHDFTAQFIQLGDASAGTINVKDFVRQGDEDRYEIVITQDTDLPRRLTVNFADIGKDQQTNTVISQRPLDAVDSNRELTIDLTTYVMEPADAQKLSDRFFRRQWNGRETVKMGLTAQLLGLEPGDVYTLELDDVTQTARLDKMTLSGGALRTEWKRDFPSLHVLGTGAGADMDGRDDDGIFVPAPTKAFVLGIPLIEDTDSSANPVIYYGAGPYGNGDWAGANIYEEDDVGTLALWNAVESSYRAPWGYATAALATADPNVWDRGNSVNINLISGSLTSCTEADIDADPTLNLAYLGGELLNFTTATLQGDGSYTLSGFKRGRRGTETYRSTHATNDLFVLMSKMKNDEVGLSDIGTTTTFRAQSLGRDITTAFPFDFTVEGNSLKPYAPARLKVYYDGTDLQCTIYRRTRVGGAWVGGTTVPLSENSEEYEVDVYNGATLKRTITVSGTNTFTYTAAMASTDGITLPTQPTFKVYQMSDAAGRGFELVA